MTIVSSCPRNREDWDRRTVEKKCYLVSQQCVPKEKFVYHCVLNVYANETLEVCAPKARIIGQSCAEFNVLGAIIQQSQTKCKEKCPFQYNSTDAYKYQECYQKVAGSNRTEESNITFKTPHLTTVLSSTTFSSFEEDCIYSVWQTVAILMITVNVILLILIILLSRKIFFKGKQDNNIKEEEVQPCLENKFDDRFDDYNLPEIKNTEILIHGIQTDAGKDIQEDHMTDSHNNQGKGDKTDLHVVAIDIGDKHVTMALSLPNSPKKVKNLGSLVRMSVLLTNRKFEDIGVEAMEKYTNGKTKRLSYYHDYKLKEEKDIELYNCVLSRLLKCVSFALNQRHLQERKLNILYVFVVPNNWSNEDENRLMAEVEKIKETEKCKLRHTPMCLRREQTLWPFIHEVNASVFCLNFNVDNLVLNSEAGITTYGFLHIGSSHRHFTVLPIGRVGNEDTKTVPIPELQPWKEDHLPETEILRQLEHIYGEESVNDWKEKNNEEYILFLSRLEKIFKELNTYSSDLEIELETAKNLLDISKQKGGSANSIVEAINKTCDIKINKDMFTLKIQASLLKSCFDKMIKAVGDLIREMEEHLTKMKCVVITGAYSNLDIMKFQAEEHWFKDMQITIALPQNLHVFAMGGAYHGHKILSGRNTQKAS